MLPSEFKNAAAPEQSAPGLPLGIATDVRFAVAARSKGSTDPGAGRLLPLLESGSSLLLLLGLLGLLLLLSLLCDLLVGLAGADRRLRRPMAAPQGMDSVREHDTLP